MVEHPSLVRRQPACAGRSQIHGAVILSRGVVFRADGRLAVYPTLERAAYVAERWNASDAFAAERPFAAARCTVKIQDQATGTRRER